MIGRPKMGRPSMGHDGVVTHVDDRSLSAMREMLTASEAGIYLAAHLAGPLPAETLAAMQESDALEQRLGRAGPDRAGDMAQRDEETRAVLAAVLRAAPEQLVLTHGTADAVRLAAQAAMGSLRSEGRPADRSPGVWLVHADLEREARAALEGAAAAHGASLRVFLEGPEGITWDCSLVAAPMYRRDGDAVDVGRLGRLARAAGAWMLVDAGLAAGAVDMSVDELGADAVIVPGNRWLLGPDAVASLWLAPATGVITARLREETSPFARSTLLGLARSVGWLLMYVSLPWVLARTAAVAAALRRGLVDTAGVEVPGPPTADGPLVVFRVAGWRAEEAAEELSRRASAILEFDEEADLLRVSAGAWLRDEDVERFLDAVAEISAHTPDSLPRRPALTILHTGHTRP